MINTIHDISMPAENCTGCGKYPWVGGKHPISASNINQEVVDGSGKCPWAQVWEDNGRRWSWCRQSRQWLHPTEMRIKRNLLKTNYVRWESMESKSTQNQLRWESIESKSTENPLRWESSEINCKSTKMIIKIYWKQETKHQSIC